MQRREGKPPTHPPSHPHPTPPRLLQPFKRQLGAGILSVMGVSFATFSPANDTLGLLIRGGDTFEDAFGKVSRLGRLQGCIICSAVRLDLARCTLPAILGEDARA